MAREPAAISARPARTTMCEEATAPERPAARAKGTVRPSERPMTMSRTVSVDSKCPSIWGSWGCVWGTWVASCMAVGYGTVGLLGLDQQTARPPRQEGLIGQD